MPPPLQMAKTRRYGPAWESPAGQLWCPCGSPSVQSAKRAIEGASLLLGARYQCDRYAQMILRDFKPI